MIRASIEMTGRALRYLSSEVRGLHAAAYVLAACALLSSLLGLVRDRYLAHIFGASEMLDVYYAGFRIPDLLFMATAALVSVYILIPELSRRSIAEQRAYIDTIIAGFSVLMIAIVLIVFVYAPRLLLGLFPALMTAHAYELVTVTRILLLQPLLLGLSNILASVTQSRHRYTLYALSPLLYNLGIIGGIALLYPLFGLTGVAWGVVAGAALHLCVQIPSVVRDGFLRSFPRVRDWSALARTAAVSVPRALALSMNQFAFLGLIVYAGTLAAGSIAVFMFAFNLQSVPLAIIGASYSVAAFPTLAAAFARGENGRFVEQVATAARYVIFWSVPASLVMLVLRAHLVRVILGTGAFDWTDTRLTAAAFALFGLSLGAQGLILLLVRAYYAAGRTLVPLFISAVTAALALYIAARTLAYLRAPAALAEVGAILRVEGLPGAEVLALPFAFALASIVGALLLTLHFEFTFGGLFARLWRVSLQSLVAGAGGGLAAYVTLQVLGPLLDTTNTFFVFLQGLGGGVAGIAAALIVFSALRSDELREVVESARARLWRRTGARDIVVGSAEE